VMSFFLVKGKELKISWQLYKSVIFRIDEIFVVFTTNNPLDEILGVTTDVNVMVCVIFRRRC